MSAEDIRDYIDEFQPLSKLIGKEAVDQLHDSTNSESVKLCYEKLMKTEEPVIAKCISEIAKDYQNGEPFCAIYERFVNIPLK